MYGLIISSTIQKVFFNPKLAGSGLANLNKILASPVSLTVLKALTAIT